MSCIVNTFSLRLDPQENRYRATAHFSLTLERGTVKESINIMQMRRGVRFIRGTVLFEHGPTAPRIPVGSRQAGRTATAADVLLSVPGGVSITEAPTWVTDQTRQGENYTCNGQRFCSGVIYASWGNAAGNRQRGQWTDTPGWNSVPDDDFPIFLGGQNCNGFYDFVTYVVCKRTRSVLCGIWWGVQISYRRRGGSFFCQPTISGTTRVHIGNSQHPSNSSVETRSLRPDAIIPRLPQPFSWNSGPH